MVISYISRQSDHDLATPTGCGRGNCNVPSKNIQIFGGQVASPKDSAGSTEVLRFQSFTLADLAKKSQKVPNEKISQKKFFSKFQKRSKKVEKMIAERTEAVSEGGNRGKVAKKEK